MTEEIVQVPTPAAVQVFQYVDTDQLKRDTSYSMADLSNAMMEQTSMLVHYGVLLAKSSKQLDDLELRLEIVEAKVYKSLKTKASAAAEKTTEDGLKRAIALHPRVVEIKHACNSAKSVESMAKIAVEAFRQRRDMLIQHGATARQEMQGEVSINRRQILEDEAKNTQDRVLANMRARSQNANG